MLLNTGVPIPNLKLLNCLEAHNICWSDGFPRGVEGRRGGGVKIRGCHTGRKVGPRREGLLEDGRQHGGKW